MPKEKTDKFSLRRRWILDLQVTDVISLEGSTFLCQACSKSFQFQQKGELTQHLRGKAHLVSIERFKKKPEVQLFLKDSVDRSNPFAKELCQAFVATGIPFEKLNNPILKSFLEKYSKRTVPCPNTLRNGYLKHIYSKALDEIRSDIGDGNVWVAIDESTDGNGRMIANLLVGKLSKDGPSICHLLMSKELEATNHSTIVQTVLDGFQLLWPGCNQSYVDARFLLFMTDAVAYMIKAGKTLKKTYTSLLHVTCLVHAFHRLAEEIRFNYPEVNQLLASLKKVFKKAPTRITAYRRIAPGLPLPPDVVITRWGTWLNCAEFYAININQIEAVLQELDEDDAASIGQAKQLLQDPVVSADLAYISANLVFLCKPIKKLQESDLTLTCYLRTLEDVKKEVSALRGPIASKLNRKLDAILARNPDLEVVKKFHRVISGDTENLELNTSLTPAQIACFKYAPLSTVDAERSFSIRKVLDAPNRRSTKVENLEMMIVSQLELNCSKEIESLDID